MKTPILKLVLVLLAMFLPQLAGAHTYETVYADNSGSILKGNLVQGSDGSFYGTGYEGGESNFGIVFKVTPEGELTNLVRFSGTNGKYPGVALAEGIDGSFYGTTARGGLNDLGTAFKVTPTGTLTTLASFSYFNGSYPSGGLVAGNDGNFYGTAPSDGTLGYGTVFKVTPAGALTTLVQFDFVNNGWHPSGVLAVGRDGNLYGAALHGEGFVGYWAAFKVTLTGTLTTLGLTIANDLDDPEGLVAGSDGNFYGTNYDTGGGNGRVFKMTPDGAVTTLARFNYFNGSSPRSGLVEGSDGNFYGTTERGGANRNGTVFRVTPTGVLTTLYSFDGTTGGAPRGTPVFGSDGSLYGTSDPTVVWRITDPTTAPTLIAPASYAPINRTVKFSFSLPQAALPGSVTLTFEGALQTRTLVLAASQETLGEHSFAFSLAAPTASQEIASGLPVDFDGPYTVTLSYEYAVGKPAASTVSNTVRTDTEPPVIGGDFSLLIAEGALPDYRSQATGDAVSYLQTPGPGTLVTVGTVTVVLEGTDAAGNVGHTLFEVRVVPSAPVHSVLESTGAPVPGAGVAGSGIPAGAVWTGFGVPSVNDVGQVAFRGDWRAGKVKGAGIFLDDALVVAKGGAFSSLGEPMLGNDGSVGFVGKTGIFLKPPGGVLHAVAQVGDVPVDGGGAVLKKLGSVAMSESGGVFFFTATLGQANGALPKVTAGNDAVLCSVVDGSLPKVRLREGRASSASPGAPVVKSFMALTERPGSVGNGRGVVEADGEHYAEVLVTGTRGEKLLGYVGSAADAAFAYTLTSDAPGYAPGTKFAKFGLPTQDGNTSIAFRAAVQGGKTGIFGEDEAHELGRLVATSDLAQGLPAGTVFAELGDPVASFEQVVAFTAKLRGGGTKEGDDESVWFRSSAGALTLVAREGAPAAELGAKWGAFKSIALPEGALGPIIVASLKSTPSSKVTEANDVGLWATDSFGALRLLFREGDTIGTAKVKSLVVLPTVRGSAAQRRSFSNSRVIVKATDTAGTQHLVQIVVP